MPTSIFDFLASLLPQQEESPEERLARIRRMTPYSPEWDELTQAERAFSNRSNREHNNPYPLHGGLGYNGETLDPFAHWLSGGTPKGMGDKIIANANAQRNAASQREDKQRGNRPAPKKQSSAEREAIKRRVEKNKRRGGNKAV